MNQWMKWHAYPLPLVTDLLLKLQNAKYFSTLDLWWVQIKKGDKWKAMFTMNCGLFKPTVMLFGLCNSPSTFQMMMATSCCWQQGAHCGNWWWQNQIISNPLHCNCPQSTFCMQAQLIMLALATSTTDLSNYSPLIASELVTAANFCYWQPGFITSTSSGTNFLKVTQLHQSDVGLWLCRWSPKDKYRQKGKNVLPIGLLWLVECFLCTKWYLRVITKVL